MQNNSQAGTNRFNSEPGELDSHVALPLRTQQHDISQQLDVWEYFSSVCKSILHVCERSF